MNIDKITEAELKQKVMKMMEDADDKVEAIYQAAAMIVEEKNKELINQLVEQNARAAHDEEYRKRLNLHNLSDKEKQFYEGLKDVKQAITAKQIDIIPDEIIDRTLDDEQMAMIDAAVKAKKPILAICRGMQLVNVYFGGTLIQDLENGPMHTYVPNEIIFLWALVSPLQTSTV